ncbi:VOC family protein [Patescibacteria group bacterium]
MKSILGHVYLYVSDLSKSYDFYNELLKYLEYNEIVKADWGFAYTSNGTSIWFEKTPKKYKEDGYHRKRIGLNHLAFRVASKADVNKFHKDFIKKNKLKTLYNSPKKFPEYSKDYYAVYFEDPDRIKIEVAFYS